jgi:hypothetical protein
LHAEEEALRQELAELEESRTLLRQQTKQMAFDSARLQIIEERYLSQTTVQCIPCKHSQRRILTNAQLVTCAARYWLNFNEFEGQLAEFCETREALLTKTSHYKRHLEKLKHTNAFNDTFHIWHDGYYGTINGLRLGRLHTQAVCATTPIINRMRQTLVILGSLTLVEWLVGNV